MTIRGGPGLAGERRQHRAVLEPFDARAGDDAAIRRLGQPPGRELAQCPPPPSRADRGTDRPSGSRPAGRRRRPPVPRHPRAPRRRAAPGCRPPRPAAPSSARACAARPRGRAGSRARAGRAAPARRPRPGPAWRLAAHPGRADQHRPAASSAASMARAARGPGRIAGVEQQHRLARRQAEPGGPRIGQARRAADPRRAQLRHHLPCRIAGRGVRPVASQPGIRLRRERCGEQRDRRPGRAEVRGGGTAPSSGKPGHPLSGKKASSFGRLSWQGPAGCSSRTKPRTGTRQDPRHPGHAIRKGSLTFTGIGLLLTHYLVEEAAEAANT